MFDVVLVLSSLSQLMSPCSCGVRDHIPWGDLSNFNILFWSVRLLHERLGVVAISADCARVRL